MSDPPNSQAGPGTSGVDLDALLAESAWIRRIAGGLLGGQDGEDLAQEVLRIALEEQPPYAGGRLRAWLHTVATRLAGNSRWRKRARAHVEEQVARPAGHEHDSNAKLQLHHKLADAIAGLEAPYRDVLVMRYFDNLPPREIAKLLELPGTTVRKRLSRGLAQLRKQLDAEFEGGREVWGMALLPFVPLPPLAALMETARYMPKAAGVGAHLTLPVLMLKTAVLVVGLVLAGVLAVLFVDDERPIQDFTPEGTGLVGQLQLTHTTTDGPISQPVQEDRVGPSRVELGGAHEEVGGHAIRLRVVDEEGAPIPGATVAWLHGASMVQLVELDGESTAALPDEVAGARFWACAEGFANGFTIVEKDFIGSEVVIELEHGQTLTGQLIEEGGPPSKPRMMRMWRLKKELGFSTRESRIYNEVVRLGALVGEQRTLTAPDGSFAFSGLRKTEGGRLRLPVCLRVLDQGGRPVDSEDPAVPFTGDVRHLVVRTARFPSIIGRAAWADGTPVHGEVLGILADGQTGSEVMHFAELEADGSFELGLAVSGGGLGVSEEQRAEHLVHSQVRLFVWPTGGPASEEEWKYKLAQQSFPLDVGVLRLERARHIELLVLGADGEALAGAAVATSTDTAMTDRSGAAELSITAGDELHVLAAGHALASFRVDDLKPPGGGANILRLVEGVTLTISFSDEHLRELGSDVALQLSWEQTPFEEGSTLEGGRPVPYRAELRRAFHGGHLILANFRHNRPGLPGAMDIRLPVESPYIVPALRPGASLRVAFTDRLHGEIYAMDVQLPLSAGTTEVDLSTAPFIGAYLKVRAWDAMGEPVQGASLFVTSREQGRGSRFESVDGLLGLGPFHVGVYDLVVQADGYLDARIEAYELASDSSALDVQLEQARSLSVKVVDEHGDPMEFESLSATDGEGLTIRPGWTDEHSLTLPMRPFEVSVTIGARSWTEWAGFDQVELTVVVPVHGKLEVAIPEQPAAPFQDSRLEMRVQGSAGEVELHRSFNDRIAGGISLEQMLLPGTYELEVLLEEDDVTSTAGGEPMQRVLTKQTITISPGECTRIELSEP